MIVINTEQLLPRPPFRAVRAHDAIAPDPISLSRADVWIDGLSILSPVYGLASAGVFKQLTNSAFVVRVRDDHRVARLRNSNEFRLPFANSDKTLAKTSGHRSQYLLDTSGLAWHGGWLTS